MTVEKVTIWGFNAHYVEDVFGGFVDWEERFYVCPECDEPVYEADWNDNELLDAICPICGFTDEVEEE